MSQFCKPISPLRLTDCDRKRATVSHFVLDWRRLLAGVTPASLSNLRSQISSTSATVSDRFCGFPLHCFHIVSLIKPKLLKVSLNKTALYRMCPGGNVPDFGRMFLMLKYTDITQNTYIQSWTVTEIMAREKCGLLAVPRTIPVSRDV
jgi:hypothetical protein